MAKFTQNPAYKQLKQLALHPFDMTTPNSITPERIDKYYAKGCGYQIFYGTERIDDSVMKALWELADSTGAMEKMKQMQAGDHVNCIQGYPSEDRPALHTATRDFFDSPQQAQTAREAAKEALQETKKLKKFIEQIDRDNRFTDLILIGIGGSELGPRAHFLALQHLLKPGRNVHFIANIDPDDTALTLKNIDLAKTLILVVSKTGTTLETSTNEAFIRERFKKAGLNPAEHIASITMSGSPMDDPKKYLASFHLWDWIGGRYSTTSMVGGVMLSFAFGFDVFWDFLRGAHEMDKVALNSRGNTNLPLLIALLGIWNRNFLNHPMQAIIPYAQALWRFPAHLQQLSMESQGKRIDIEGNPVDFDTGPIIWGEVGSNSQHSFYQLLHQGTTVVPLELIGFKKSQLHEDFNYQSTTSQQKLLSNLFAQMLALATGQSSDNPNKAFPGNRPSHLILGEQLTPFALGVLLSLYEHKVAFQGFIWGINPFDQEGVQLGKVLANKIIGRFAGSKNSPAYPVADAFLKHL